MLDLARIGANSPAHEVRMDDPPAKDAPLPGGHPWAVPRPLKIDVQRIVRIMMGGFFTWYKQWWRRSLVFVGLVGFEFADDEVDGIENIGVYFSITVVIQDFALVFGYSLPDERFHRLSRHPQGFMKLLIVAFFIVWAHLLSLYVALDVFFLQFVDDLLLFQPFLVFRHFLGFDDVVDELRLSRCTFKMISLITG